MRDTEKIILKLLGRALFQCENPISKVVDWNAVYKEATMQTVSLLVWDRLTKDELKSMPEHVRESWHKDVIKLLWLNERLVVEQRAILKLLEDKGGFCV